MPFRVDLDKLKHVLLFVTQCLGGTADISRLYALLYLADVMHLVKYGTLITGDTYIAMKSGPVPFNILSMYTKLKRHPLTRMAGNKQLLVMSVNEKQEAVAHIHSDSTFLSESEVECLFFVLHKYKNTPIAELQEITRSKAWVEADASGEIKLAVMAAAHGASTNIINYIKMSSTDELNSFQQYEKDTE